ncbi:Crp/Fnr family transcriptional regulator [Sphingobacteriaceae bacterium WQ 2009]|uniref:Crp/Fnr family transcriptional regulator n=1 Tax=Rhinopithecimicrobium faecis TaxID=2820698 RepID=A0A8T4H9V5_9SPHI|nr:Crp/Fnr family transcriptional regulator [Sphingobacteriaceae bacterium WQ 2009]
MEQALFDSLNRYLTNCVQLNSADLADADSYFERKVYPKKTFLLQAGEVCKFEAFILKGCIKTYFLDEKGHEVILTFSTEDWWVSDIASFQDQKPSKMYIETLEECELLLLNPSKKELLLTKMPVLERAFRLMLQKHLSVYQERIFCNVSLSAPERYELFLQRYPKLSNRVSQQLIASYLGITPESLSRMRNKRAKPTKV